MSDTHGASIPAPAAAPAPQQAVINPSPVHQPTPVGSQAPPAPVGDMAGSPHRPESRRETIQKAFSRANERAGMGHNNPPEPMARERQAPKKEAAKAPKSEPGPKIDLKKRPTEPLSASPEPPGETASPQRARQTQPGAPDHAARPAAPQLPPHAPYHQPPSPNRWSEAARAHWANTPETVRADVHRMHHEFNRAYQALSADKQTMDSIRHYDQLARQQGTTLAQALTNYDGIERQLRADPIAGLNTIVNNLNLRTSDGRQIGLRDIAYYLSTQTPESHQALQTRTQQTTQAAQMGQLMNAYNQLAQNMRAMQYRQQFRQTRRGVDRFAETHPRLEELADDIQRELRHGYKLPEAYRRAELLKPAAHAVQNRNTSAQTRHMDRSISGAPSGAIPNGDGRTRKPSATPRDAVANALRRVNGSV